MPETRRENELRDLLASMSTEPSATSQPAPRCPHCAEPYNPAASACKHCGRRIAEKSEAWIGLILAVVIIGGVLWVLGVFGR